MSDNGKTAGTVLKLSNFGKANDNGATTTIKSDSKKQNRKNLPSTSTLPAAAPAKTTTLVDAATVKPTSKDKSQKGPLVQAAPSGRSNNKNGSDQRLIGKKRKRSSPFRIKVGCVVALRHIPGGNHVSTSYSDGDGDHSFPPQQPCADVWIDPPHPSLIYHHHHQGRALLGKRIRCCFPKSVLLNGTAKTRFVEGEIIGLLPEQEGRVPKDRTSRHAQKSSFAVELLVDRSVLEQCPFLERLDTSIAVDISKLTDAAEKRRHHYEERIRGKNKVIVRVQLSSALKLGTALTNADSDVDDDHKQLVAKWVIRWQVPVSVIRGEDVVENNNGGDDDGGGDSDHGDGGQKKKKKKKKRRRKLQSNELYVGDKNDDSGQQERNWRWLVRHMLLPPSSLLQHSITTTTVGEVLEANLCRGEMSKHSLALLKLKPLLLPETVVDQAAQHHQPTTSSQLLWENADSHDLLRVPIEEAIIIHKSVNRSADNNNNKHNNNLNQTSTTQAYSFKTRVLRSINNGTDESSVSVMPPCHRCSIQLTKILKHPVISLPLCKPCLKSMKRQARACVHLMSCQCRQCSMSRATKLTTAFQSTLKNISHQDLPNKSEPQRECSSCMLLCPIGVCCPSCGRKFHKYCLSWNQSLSNIPLNGSGPLCRGCSAAKGEASSSRTNAGDVVVSDQDHFAAARSLVKRAVPIDFDLEKSCWRLVQDHPPSEKPITTANKNHQAKSLASSRKGKASNRSPAKRPRSPVRTDKMAAGKKEPKVQRTHEPFVPTSSRLLAYNPVTRRFEGAVKHRSESRPSQDRVRNVRLLGAKKAEETEKKTESRAARANQRRLMKDVAAIGAASMELDALAGREQHLRFDRSSIHAWGVFADEEIHAGEMVVEYRGEIIGNAMAEKREKEYERAKIGSDYMFRIDGTTVCDATKQGNVARFINASCDPNCYTQIVTLSGTKRIVVYAKKDILPGQELCYDYKFPIEYNEKKRIPCHCGSPECRGFMNWNKKYVLVPTPDGKKCEVEVRPQQESASELTAQGGTLPSRGLQT